MKKPIRRLAVRCAVASAAGAVMFSASAFAAGSGAPAPQHPFPMLPTVTVQQAAATPPATQQMQSGTMMNGQQSTMSGTGKEQMQAGTMMNGQQPKMGAPANAVPQITSSMPATGQQQAATTMTGQQPAMTPPAVPAMKPGKMAKVTPRHHWLVPSEQVRQVQQALRDEGYGIKVDGLMGPETRGVLKYYQAKHNLKVTGRIDQETLSSLNTV